MYVVCVRLWCGVSLEVSTSGGVQQTYEFVSFVSGVPSAAEFSLPPFGSCGVAPGAAPKPFPHIPSTDYSAEIEGSYSLLTSHLHLVVTYGCYADVMCQ